MRPEPEFSCIYSMHPTYKVTSSPGDGTKYVYLMTEVGDRWYFMPVHADFAYPRGIDKFFLSNGDKPWRHVLTIAQRDCVNPFTARECLRAMAAVLHINWECPLDEVGRKR